MRNCFRGITLGFGFGASGGFTGSARRTSGSDAFGCGIGGGATLVGWVGFVVGVIAAAGVGLTALSIGKGRGATIDSVAAEGAGVTPTTWWGLGLRRWTSRIHFMARNPTTRTMTPTTKGRNEPRPLLCLRITTGRLGAGSGLSWR